ncbi:MAG: hypothetical protein K2M07_02055 [Muribaculaceae bacterium]|nr:hypothetical protein [Muribaculaceae bacterium]
MTLRNKNMRLDTETGTYIPTKSPLRFSESAITPLLSLPGGNLLLCYSGSTLYILDRTDDSVSLTFDTGARILTAVVCGPELCTVYLSSGQLHLRYQSAKWIPVSPFSFPEVKIRRIDASHAEASVGQRKLTGSYTLTDHSLNATDNAALSADILEAYRIIRQEADSAGFFIQPVVARARYLDHNGRTLFLTPPVLISNENIFQCNSTITSVIDSNAATRGGVTLSAETFRLQIEFPEALRPTVAKVLIEATPQLDLVDFAGETVAALLRGSDGRLSIRASLPLLYSTNEGRQLLAQSVIEHLESLFKVIASVASPFNGESSTLHVGPDATSTGDLKTAVNAMRRTISAPVSGPSPNGLPDLARPPHTVTCSSVAKNGDTLLMGDMTLLPFRGYALDTFGCGFTNEKWKASVTVEFAGEDEETVVRFCEGSSDSPTLLSPVITYPRADAIRMTISFQSGGKCYSHRFNLSPSRSGDFSFFISPGLEPIDITETEADFFIVPAEKPVTHRFPGTVGVAHASTPTTPCCLRHISHSPITTLTHALGSGAGWDYVRSRFYVFSPEGTFTVITDESAIRGINKIDSRGVSVKANVIPVTRRGVAVLTDSADLLLWRGIAPESAGRNLHGTPGYDTVHDEFWLMTDELLLSGPASAKLPFDPSLSSERSLLDKVTAVIHLPEGTILRGINGLYLLGGEDQGEEMVNVRFTRSLKLTAPVKGVNLPQRRKGKRVRSIRLTMQSPGPVNLTVSMHADNGAGYAFSPSFCRFKVRGAVNSPLLFHTPAPHLHTLHLTADGLIPSNSSITDFETVTESYEP